MFKHIIQRDFDKSGEHSAKFYQHLQKFEIQLLSVRAICQTCQGVTKIGKTLTTFSQNMANI